jgi:outer membrane protein TolC
MYDAQDSLAIATAERLRASVALYEALGGGWKLGQPLEARATPLDRGRRPSVRALD